MVKVGIVRMLVPLDRCVGISGGCGFEQPHVEEPAFGIALAEQTRDEARRGAGLTLFVMAL
jgi:hypothetical protein